MENAINRFKIKEERWTEMQKLRIVLVLISIGCIVGPIGTAALMYRNNLSQMVITPQLKQLLSSNNNSNNNGNNNNNNNGNNNGNNNNGNNNNNNSPNSTPITTITTTIMVIAILIQGT